MANDQNHQEAKPRYGRRKLGDEQYEKQAAAKQFSTREGTRYGARKGNLSTPAAPAPTGTGSGAAAGAKNPLDGASIGTLSELLAKRPQLLDAAIELEARRAGGPRKGALEVFIEVEQKREGGPRPDVLERLGVEPEAESDEPTE